MRVTRILATLVVALVLTACGVGTASDEVDVGSTDGSASGETSAVAEQAEGRVLIDVRTPEEFAAGHLEGARNIDVQAADFEARIAELPEDEAYFVYCRTGNRSGQAIDRMRALGFTDMVNGGGFDDLAEAGLATAG